MKRRGWVAFGLLACASCHERTPGPSASDDRVTAATSSTLVGVDASDEASYPDCHGFGGRIHGASTCVHLTFSSATIQPLAKRPLPGASTTELACGKEARLQNIKLVLICDRTKPPPDAGIWEKDVVVSVDLFSPADAGKPKRVRLDSYRFFWDFINVWVKETPDGVDLAIDYGVLD